MATLTLDAEGPGKGGFRPLFANLPRGGKVVTGKFSFDNSYPTGGEDISGIFDQFKSLLGLYMASPLSSAGTGKHVEIDYTNKKAKLLTNAAIPAEVANASDQSGAIDLRFIAWGV